MSWRGTAGGIAAATAGHDVIMTPNSHVYFDHYQGDPEYEPLANGGFSPLEHVYAFDPVPPGLSPTAAARVLGGQGNVWTEYIKTWDRVEYMVFPRALALAEVLWSPADRRDLADFLARLEPHLRRLEVLGVGYRVPDVLGLEDGLVLGNSVTVSFGPVWTTSEIRYTTDGSVPTDAARAYTGPFTVDVSAGPVQVRARRTMRDGRRSAVAEGTFERTTLRPAERPGTVEPGLRLGRADRVLRTVDDIGTTTPEGVATEVAIPADVDGPVALRFEGLFRAHADGVHAFHLTSDDGSRLRIGNHTVVDNDGPHAALQKTGRIALAAGWHPIVIDFFDSGGGRTLRLEVTRPDGTRGIARPESLGHR